jgi:hypothetical protein
MGDRWDEMIARCKELVNVTGEAWWTTRKAKSAAKDRVLGGEAIGESKA